MARLHERTFTLCDAMAMAVAGCLFVGALSLLLHHWLRLPDAAERAAILSIELAGGIFALFLSLFFISLLSTAVERFIRARRRRTVDVRSVR